MEYIIAALAAAILVYGALYDAKHHIIPHWISITVLFLAVIKWFSLPAGRMQQILGFGITAVLFISVYIMISGKGLGGGDVKLIIALGALTGIQGLLVLLFVASISGLVFLLATKRKTLAFAPCLTIGYLISQLL